MQSSRNTTNIPTADQIFEAQRRKLQKAAEKTAKKKLASKEYVFCNGRVIAAELAEVEGLTVTDDWAEAAERLAEAEWAEALAEAVERLAEADRAVASVEAEGLAEVVERLAEAGGNFEYFLKSHFISQEENSHWPSILYNSKNDEPKTLFIKKNLVEDCESIDILGMHFSEIGITGSEGWLKGEVASAHQNGLEIYTSIEPYPYPIKPISNKVRLALREQQDSNKHNSAEEQDKLLKFYLELENIKRKIATLANIDHGISINSAGLVIRNKTLTNNINKK